MPIVKLFIEGNLEAEVLNPILQGSPAILRGGSKNSLRPRAFSERSENKVSAGYLRDRDFDYDPPSDLAKPEEDSLDGGVPFGWRWCRHELENYLLEPAVVGEAMQWPLAEVADAIRSAAVKIRSYEAARWTVGIVRRKLPPHHELKTRPDGLNEIGLPAILDAGSVSKWAFDSIVDHRNPIVAITEPTALQASFNALAVRFDDAFVADPANVLLWFSGKDLLAGLADWLTIKGLPNPGAFRAALRDWIIANSERAVDLLPEWNGMVKALRA